MKFYDEQYGDDEEEVAAPMQKAGDSHEKAELLEAAMLNAFGNSRKRSEHVNLEKLMAEGGLDDLFPAEAWPELNAARDLATDIKAAKKGAMVSTCCVNNACVSVVDEVASRTRRSNRS